MLYGKWRPNSFAEICGQDHIVTTLKNALTTGQVAHAYLFSGPRGTGKTTTARILARALNCASPVDGEPCNECPSCAAIARGNAMDLVEMDAASNRGIDDVRDLREKIAFAPSDLKYKVYLLDEVHMLTPGAFNALLKTLEEPPPHAYFILATTESHQVPPTIVSRCQRYDFRRVSLDAMMDRLRFIAEQEGITIGEAGLEAIAKEARGGLRDGITLLEQVASRYGQSPSDGEVLEALGLVRDERTARLADAVEGEDLGEALTIAREVADGGVNIARFAKDVVNELRERQLAALRENDAKRARALTTAISELAKADFRLDPASPVPLEVACATAILGVPQAVSPAVEPAQQGRQPNAQPRGTRAAPVDRPLSKEEKFLKDLYNRCRLVNVRAAGWLNGSCEVLSLGEDELSLGFYHRIHMEKVANETRTLIEQQAEQLLGRPVRLNVKLVERNAATERKPKGGHLAEAAKALGATPVERTD